VDQESSLCKVGLRKSFFSGKHFDSMR